MYDKFKKIASRVFVNRLRVATDINKKFELSNDGVGILYFSKKYNMSLPINIGDLNSFAEDLSNLSSASLKAVKAGGKNYNIVVAVNKVNPYDVQLSYNYNADVVDFKVPVRFLYSNLEGVEGEPSLSDFLVNLGFEKII